MITDFKKCRFGIVWWKVVCEYKIKFNIVVVSLYLI